MPSLAWAFNGMKSNGEKVNKFLAISRFLITDSTSRTENWKLIPDHCFENYGGLHFLLRCNCELLNQMEISLSYKQILTYFLEL